jgi:hypothetical protein
MAPLSPKAAAASPAKPAATPPPKPSDPAPQAKATGSARTATAKAAAAPAKAPPAKAASPAPPRPPEPPAAPAPPEPAFDAEAALDFARTLVRTLDRLNRDDPILRDIRDEVETLRRAVYSPSSKPAWVTGSLRSLLGLLEEAAGHPFAEDMRTGELMSAVERMLKA